MNFRNLSIQLMTIFLLTVNVPIRKNSTLDFVNTAEVGGKLGYNDHEHGCSNCNCNLI